MPTQSQIAEEMYPPESETRELGTLKRKTAHPRFPMPNNRLSVIIPTLNNAATLPTLLQSLKYQTRQPDEVIVVDNHSSDGTIDIAREAGARVLVGGPERSAQRNLGANQSSSDGLLFVDSDMTLTPGVVASCVKGLECNDALILREITLCGEDIWGKARAFEKSRYYGSLYFEAARCLKRSVFELIGGYDVRLTGTEDIDLQAKLIEGAYKIGWVPQALLHHEEEVGILTYLRKRAYYSLTDRLYSEAHPQLWLIQKSWIRRIKAILSHDSCLPHPPSVAVLLALFVQRA